ncbi:helix-turn-helix domain-containing protein [Micromonospora sp. KC606]|uniref:winged helix-turn-helix transcriptional regulator n=1 Tax=Micromonospora sp. KC606 TaxID=2530379 RepID=UPI0024413396|nr:helix-turn-helix domain-containing protein [Micromonospora sp. KC606]
MLGQARHPGRRPAPNLHPLRRGHPGSRRRIGLSGALLRLPAASPKVLTQRLRQLERDGLVTRTYHAEMPPRVEYEPTDLGRTLPPVFQTLVTWANSHLDQVIAARRRYDAGPVRHGTSPRPKQGAGRPHRPPCFTLPRTSPSAGYGATAAGPRLGIRELWKSQVSEMVAHVGYAKTLLHLCPARIGLSASTAVPATCHVSWLNLYRDRLDLHGGSRLNGSGELGFDPVQPGRVGRQEHQLRHPDHAQAHVGAGVGLGTAVLSDAATG